MQTKTKAGAARTKSTKIANPTKFKSKLKQTKTAIIIALLRRRDGASIAELQKATGWQAHSVRGLLSGTIKKRLGLTLKSETDDQGIRRYRVKSAPLKVGA
jgi:Protein of unknown function (DUF3489)